MGKHGKLVKIEFHSKGFRDLLFDSGVKTDLQERADAIAQAANADLGKPGFESGMFTGRFGGGRPVATVKTANRAGMKAEAEDKILSRNLDAGRS